ncbi:uncharacterized protein LOC118600012 [Oryzias melastigma]|uniref:uncharacterized protein LOC118600012 n=1 Tax=Oryzias melastigma TaxID=30732 RepID=UPI00168CDF35|nr:uncharacterized protein LOC118600012 [Oryzias melastigma]
MPALWGYLPGRSSHEYAKLKVRNQIMHLAHLECCMSPPLLGLRSSPGGMPLESPVTPVSIEPSAYSVNISSGPQWRKTCGNSWPLAPPDQSPPPLHKRVCSTLCPLPADLGRTSLWTGLPPSNGNTVILTVIDRFSKSAQFIPLPQLPTPMETATILVNQVFLHHGIPTDIVSDREPQFISQVWRAFCSALGATVSLSSGYHPQSNGQAERANQELEAALRCLAAKNPADWSSFLVWIEYAHNTHLSSATGVSPFEASLGYLPPLFPSQEADLAVPSVLHHLRRCRHFWRQTKPCFVPRNTTARLQTVTGFLLPPTSQVRKYDSPPVTSPSRPLLANSRLVLLDPMSLTR